MRRMLKGFVKDFKYTWEHKKAFLKTEKELLGRNTISGYLHDTDKLFLYLIYTKQEVSKIHRSYSRHHIGNHKSEKDKIQAIIDWRSAKLTKPDKQEGPTEYLFKYIPEYVAEYKPVLLKLQLWEPRGKKILTNKR